MNPVTVSTLKAFPRALEAHYAAFPQDRQLDCPAEFERYGPVTLRGLVHYFCSRDQQHLAGLQWLLGKIDAEASHG